MRSLDRFYEYLEKQEKASQQQEGRDGAADTGVAESNGIDAVAAALPVSEKPKRAVKRTALPKPAELPGAAQPGFRYILRGGVTVAVPIGTPEPEEEAVLQTPVSVEEVEAEAAVEASVVELLPADTEDEEEAESGAAGWHDTAIDYLPPLVEEEPPQVADAPARVRGGGMPRRTEEETATVAREELSEGDAAALWRRLPRHIQLLVGMTPEPREEVAQKYYTRGFKETRHQLIERLLDPTLTLEDTARVLGVCPTTVRRYTNRGTLPCHRTIGQQRRFRLSDVLAFLEKQQAEGVMGAFENKGRKGGSTA